MEEGIKYVFAVGIFGMIFFLFVSAFIHHSPDKQKKLKELKEKEEKQKNELKAITVQMIIALNKMLASGAISEVDYSIEIDKTIELLRTSNIDYSFIFTIKKPTPYDRGQKLKEIMNIASTLDDRGEMSKEDYEKRIDSALDELKKLK